MPTYNKEKQQFISRAADPVDPEYGIFDGMASAAEETLRSLPISAIGRQIDKWADSSEKIDAMAANEEFGLEGEAAFQEGEEVTKYLATERAQDQSFLAMNEAITSEVNQDAPILGRLTQFGASIAAGFADPVLLGLGAGAHMAATAGIAKVMTTGAGRAVQNRLLSVSEPLGNLLHRSYSQAVNKKAIDYIVRETGENFLASLAEETINFAGVGDDQLARKVTAQESLFNIVAGTAMGTGFGIALDRGARKAMMSGYNRKFGDDAATLISTDAQIKDMEGKMGIGQDNLHNKIADEEAYDPKIYYTEPNVPNNDVMYISIDEEGRHHSYSNRGRGLVGTDNINHAQNKGAKVREIKIADMKILDEDTFSNNKRVQSKSVNTLADALVNNADDTQLSMIKAHLEDPTADPSMVSTKRVRTQLKKDIKKLLSEANSLDEMLDTLDYLNVTGKVGIEPHDFLDNMLKDIGYDGYSYTASRNVGGKAYKGTYIKNDSQGKIITNREFETPKPDNVHQADIRARNQQRLEAYTASLRDRSKKVDVAEKEIASTNKIEGSEEVKSPLDLPEGEPITVDSGTVNSTASSIYGTNSKQKAAVDEMVLELQNRRKAGETLDKEDLADLEMLERIQKKEDLNSVADEHMEKIQSFADCMLGKPKAKKTGNFAGEDIGF